MSATADALKRPAPEPGGAADGPDGSTKKPRLDGAAQPASKPALSLEALEKAKRALQLQKELKEKLKKLPQVRVRQPVP
jgi:U4/U6 small nuclear ribonucleoprotein PRP3